MPAFQNDGLTLAYDDITPAGGARTTVVLIHGFVSNRNEAWRRTGWYGAFERRGCRVIALDQRGHGESAKPHEPEAYLRANLAGDVLALMNHLQIAQADVFGYSMGARTALATGLAAPERVSNLILGGVGARLLEERPGGAGASMAEALTTENPGSIEHPMQRNFRMFAEQQGDDREALAAMSLAVNPPWNPPEFATIRAPVLVVTGQRDLSAGDPDGLAEIFPSGRGVSVAGCDHFSAIPHGLTKAAVFDFLDGLLDDPFAR